MKRRMESSDHADSGFRRPLNVCDCYCSQDLQCLQRERAVLLQSLRERLSTEGVPLSGSWDTRKKSGSNRDLLLREQRKNGQVWSCMIYQTPRATTFCAYWKSWVSRVAKQHVGGEGAKGSHTLQARCSA